MSRLDEGNWRFTRNVYPERPCPVWVPMPNGRLVLVPDAKRTPMVLVGDTVYNLDGEPMGEVHRAT